MTTANEVTTSLSRVFWGLLLVILDIKLNQIDLLPDFLGYILVAVGLGGLVDLSVQFVTARTYAWVLVPVSLVGFLPWGPFGLVLGLIHLGVDCAMMWFLLGGIMDYTAARNRSDLAERASNRRVAYIALMCGAPFLTVIAHGVGVLAVLPLAATVICFVVLLVMILHLLHRVQMEVTP